MMTSNEAVFAIRHLRAVARACYGQDPQESVHNSTLPTIEPRPSIHTSGLLQWQAGEFDREAPQVAEAQRPRPCSRYPQDCAGEDWGPGEWDECPYMKSGGRTACGWKAG